MSRLRPDEDRRDTVPEMPPADVPATEAECLRAALGWIPLSVREAIARGDIVTCRRWADRRVTQVCELEEQREKYRRLWDAERTLADIRGRHARGR